MVRFAVAGSAKGSGWRGLGLSAVCTGPHCTENQFSQPSESPQPSNHLPSSERPVSPNTSLLLPPNPNLLNRTALPASFNYPVDRLLEFPFQESFACNFSDTHGRVSCSDSASSRAHGALWTESEAVNPAAPSSVWEWGCRISLFRYVSLLLPASEISFRQLGPSNKFVCLDLTWPAPLYG